MAGIALQFVVLVSPGFGLAWFPAADEDVTFRIYSMGSPAPGLPGTDNPSGNQLQFIGSELLTFGAASMASASPDGWIPDGQNETAGNNVAAQLDLDADNIPDGPRPQGLPYRVFNFTSDPQIQDPAQFQEAAVVQAFYLCNLYHDRLYLLGFDEAAHNFQQDNFGLGGTGGDRIDVDVQDGQSSNGAMFATGTQDGSAARLQLYIFPATAPDRDGALERDLIFHELTRGVVIRLLESSGAGDQPLALVEGWGDFMALSLEFPPGLDPHACYPFAPYVARQFWVGYEDNYYFGLRRYPYCTDMTKNPLTYAFVDPAQLSFPPGVSRNANITSPANDPQNAGEVWCITLMECRAALMDRDGFSGNETMLQLVVDGMKISPSNPTFIEARDAILTADLANNSGINVDILWQAFAKRGLGAASLSPSVSAQGIVESFLVPDLLLFGYPEGLPDVVVPEQEASLSVVIRPVGNAAVTPGSAMLHYSIDGGSFVEVALTQTGLGSYEAMIPGQPCGSRIDYYFSVSDAVLGDISDPATAPSESFETVSAIESFVTLSDDFETDTGWSVGDVGDSATAGLWSRVDPEQTTQSGQDVQPDDDQTPSPGVACWVTDGAAGASAGANDVDGGSTSLLSPLFGEGGSDAKISYWRWYSNSAGANPGEDTLVVSLSNDGGQSWVIAEVVGPSGPQTEGGWFLGQFSVSDFMIPTSSMMLKFVASDLSGGSLVEAAIDDVTVTVFRCDPPLPGDADQDGDVDLADHAAFDTCLSGPDTLAPSTPIDCESIFDFDADSDVDLEDWAAFERALSMP